MVETSALASSNIHLTFPLSLALFPWQPVKSAGKRHSCFQKKEKEEGKKKAVCSFKARVLVTLFPPLSVSPFGVCVFPAQLSSSSETSAGAATLRGQRAGWGRLCHPGDGPMNHEILQKTTWDCRETEGSTPRRGLLEGGDAVPFLGQGVLPARHIPAEPHTTCTALRSATSPTLRISLCSLSLSEPNSSLTKIKTRGCH